LKKYLSEVKDGVLSNTVWLNEMVGSTQLAKEHLKKILENNVFDTPKPIRVYKKNVAIIHHQQRYYPRLLQRQCHNRPSRNVTKRRRQRQYRSAN